MAETLGQYLLSARKKNAKSLRSLAAELEITPSYLSDIENDRRIPAEETITDIAAALGLDTDDLMVRAGRLGQETERYFKEQPEAIRLLRMIARANLSAKQLIAMQALLPGLPESSKEQQ